MTRVDSAVCSILRGWFPQLDGVSLGIVDSGEAAIRIVLRIELHFDASGAELCGHPVQAAHAEVDHPHLMRVAEIFGGLGEGREDRGTGFGVPGGLTVAGGDWGDSQVNAIPLGKRFGIVGAKEQAADAEDSLGGQSCGGG